MRFRILLGVIIFMLAVLFFGTKNVFAFSGSGDGLTADTAFRITTCLQLQEMENDLDAYYILDGNIDCLETEIWNDGAGFLPIGNESTPFTGNLDGANRIIRDFYINRPTTDSVGLFGFAVDAVISNVVFRDLDITGRSVVGGLGGTLFPATITNSYSSGSVSGSDGGAIGGLVGYMGSSSIDGSYSTCSVSGSNAVGGLVGNIETSSIFNSYSAGSVLGDSNVGGLVGYNADGSSISNSYAMGSVAGESYVGGLVGYNGICSISNSYSAGLVSGSSDVGGLIGLNDAGSWEITNSFYDSETSGQSDEDKGEAKTTAEMKEVNTFIDANWDFPDVWTINSTDNNGYPALAWQGFENEEEFCGEGDGTEESPYGICNWKNLNKIRYHLDVHFILMNDMDEFTEGYAELASETANDGAGWQPIGTWGDRFEGSFDGNGNKISNLFIDMSDESELGLFGFAGVNANISNVVLEDVDIFGSTWVGGLIGLNRGSVSNSSTTGSVSGAFNFVGGLIGSNDRGSISNSYSACSVSGDDSIGGLVGKNWGPISNSYATGSVSGDEKVGGLVGENYSSSISNSYSVGSVSGSSDFGGLLGYNNGDSTILNSFWDINTSGQETSILGTGKTTVEMKTVSTFIDAGWDFPDVWTINSTDNNGYPALAWQGFELDEEEEEIIPAETPSEPERAKIASWSAVKYTDSNKSCSKRLKLTIKGKHFDEDAKVFIGGKEASSVDVKNSKKLTAKFCLAKLTNNKTDKIRVVSVKNPDTKKRKADKQIDLNDLSFENEKIEAINNYYNQKIQEGARHIQEDLNKLGYLDQENITGTYGTITTESVKKFQSDNGIESTGFVGPLTKAKLVEKLK